MIRILIADDFADTRRGLRAVLESKNRLVVCGEASSGSEAVEKACELKPDVVVLDLRMPSGNGIETALKISTLMPAVPIALISVFPYLALEGAVAHAGIWKVFNKSEVNTLRDWIDSLFPAVVPRPPQEMPSASVQQP